MERIFLSKNLIYIKMKQIILQVTFLLYTTIAFSQDVSFNIIKDKTTVDEYGAVTLQVEVENKSSEAITIFKPAEKYNQKWRYYGCDIKCDDFPYWFSGNYEYVGYNSDDLLEISAKSKVTITINGLYNGLSCSSKKFKVKLIYDVVDFIKNKEDLTPEEVIVIQKLTPIRIVSKQVEIKVE
ncbi:conserved exported hypothetical protein [Capnocytophaga canimorsus]|uniref:Uncharacterized protein n=2 Tax=Capnocytophaga canimorsus TaxID=28188 RepID=A0A0B7H811_9FLAO|nr:hypothetical protein CGC47_00245 [Capnocytophaga canimorsus]PJI80346.1 hypothetical protein CLV61_1200 [Capnocytophaga canimorsus]CEN35515.1 conserved exported hypothetical protein [Capnocytophaga canimorsus]STA71253.1 Uncharacterised protein [Capnocytophaga canimorsus]GIM56997.1 hypothetical protein CAPN006_13900 [Capnocytophaga canimorsus]